MHSNPNSRNYGYGHQLRYAVRKALEHHYGQACHSTQAAHRSRLKGFRLFLQQRGIRDFRRITTEVLVDYAKFLVGYVDEELLANKTAKNRLSSVNVLMSALRNDNKMEVGLSEYFDRISSIRTTVPRSMCEEQVLAAMESLDSAGQSDVAGMVGLCRFFGLRSRESALLDLGKAKREAETRGAINIQKGTKGGRNVPRWVPVTYQGMCTIQRSYRIRSGTGCLIPKSESWKKFYQHAYYQLRKVAGEYELADGFHDFRASYACSRYRAITGFDAPVLVGEVLAEHLVDLNARDQISREMGHSRVEIVGSYIGGRR